MATTSHRCRPLALLVAALLSGLAGLVVLLPATAHAEGGYRYWNYFHLKGGSWEFSQVGAGDYQPKDGAVEAYRFGTSTVAKGVTPRANPRQLGFAEICANVEEEPGKKRVAVLFDYGNEADAEGASLPDARAACAVVDEGANGQQVLEEVAVVRVEKSLTCAIDGYPAAGCGEPVKNATVPADEKPIAFTMPETAAEAPETESPGEGASDPAESATSEPGTSESAAPDETTAAAAEAEDVGADEDGSGLAWPLIGAALLVVVIAGTAFALNRRNRSA
jgi:hypothetical protein